MKNKVFFLITRDIDEEFPKFKNKKDLGKTLYEKIVLSESDDENEQKLLKEKDLNNQKEIYLNHFDEIEFSTKNKQKKKRKYLLRSIKKNCFLEHLNLVIIKK